MDSGKGILGLGGGGCDEKGKNPIQMKQSRVDEKKSY